MSPVLLCPRTVQGHVGPRQSSVRHPCTLPNCRIDSYGFVKGSQHSGGEAGGCRMSGGKGEIALVPRGWAQPSLL